MTRINAFSRNVNSINLKNIEYRENVEKIKQAFWKEIKPYRVYRNMKRCIFEANIEGQGW